MLPLIEKLILLLFGITMIAGETPAVFSVAALLSAMTLSAFNQYFRSKHFAVASSVIYFAAGTFLPVFCPFMPLFCFDLFMSGQRVMALSALIPIIIHISGRTAADTFFILLLIALAALMQLVCEKIELLTGENKRIRDSSAELNRMLMEKNEHLIEKQNYEIHLATLKERNRIAREIHDNVGHILSRSILQTGALQAINKDKRLTEHLTELKDTLSLAMDSIRNSVHGLRDESLNLYESICAMTEHLNYSVNVDYDVTQDFSNDVKYCFIAVLKEALTNIAKHSDATRIRIAVQEHPAICQLLIHDNGTKKMFLNRNGMGLANMEERVAAFGGQFSASYQNGFRIFISIPKQEAAND